MGVIKGKTRSGFEFEVSDTVGDNMELLEAIAEAEENPIVFARIVSLLIGKKQKKELYNYLRGEDGIVHIEPVSEAIADIFGSITGSKNF